MRRPSPRFRGIFHRLRTEGEGALRETAAVSLGIFIGCLPIYGFHLAICWAVGFVLGLNRLKMSLASNISNPFVAPWLIFAEIQIGALARRGMFHSLSRVEITTATLGVFGVDALVGSLFVGGVLAAVAAAGTYRLVRRTDADPFFGDLVRRASDRYLAGSIIGWEIARARLRTDPLYRAVLMPGFLPCSGTVVDIGCGRGLMLALLAEARLAWSDRRWPAETPEPPRFERLLGLETRPRLAASARAALEGDAEIAETGTPADLPGPFRAALLFDVLHRLRLEEQEALLGALASRLERGGVVLVRELDVDVRWRSTIGRASLHLKSLMPGRTHRGFHPRTRAEWQQCFARQGLHSEVSAVSAETPGVVFFRLTRADESGSARQLSLPA